MDISYSELRKSLKSTTDIASHIDDDSLTETAYLLKNPAMAKRLLEAVLDVKKDKVSMHGLIDEK